jgi:Tol biopolymer transport system component
MVAPPWVFKCPGVRYTLAVPALVLATVVALAVTQVRGGQAFDAHVQGVKDGSLVFASSTPTASDIVAVNVDGSGTRNLTPDHAPRGDLKDSEPAVSPDGTKIAFARIDAGFELHVMSRDGTNRRPLGVGGVNPVWSPDSKRLAYWDIDHDDGVHVVNADGSGDHAVSDYANYGFGWSPDGRELAYGDEDGLHVVPADGSSGATIAPVPDAWRVAWSPDGRTIACFSNENDDLYFVSRDGSSSRVVKVIEPDPATPSWSPDSERVAVSGVSGTRVVQVFSVERATGAVIQLTRSREASGTPVWSPDGKRIAYVRERSTETGGVNGADIWVVTADGRSTWPVTRAFPTGATADEIDPPEWLDATRRITTNQSRIRTVKVPTIRRVRLPEATDELAMDGAQAVFTTGERNTIHLWSPTTGGRRAFGPYPCDMHTPTLSGALLAWTCWESRDLTTVYGAAVRSGRSFRIRGRFNDAVELSASGGLLAFRDFNTVWRIRGRRAVILRRGSALVSISVDDGRLAELRRTGIATVLRPDGSPERVLRLSPGAEQIALAGNLLFTVERGRLRVFDVSSGKLRRTIVLGNDVRLEDVRDGLVVYVVGIAVHVRSLRSGRDIVLSLPHQAGEVHARLMPGTLVYSYNRAYDLRPGGVEAVAIAMLNRILGN